MHQRSCHYDKNFCSFSHFARCNLHLLGLFVMQNDRDFMDVTLLQMPLLLTQLEYIHYGLQSKSRKIFNFKRKYEMFVSDKKANGRNT